MTTTTTTSNVTCRMIADVLWQHGVRDVVVSPGSRNAPLIVAVSRYEGLTTHVVIDERSAAFVGLGIALQTSRPVALICTSGSAVLNYAPAMAEAFYRHIPLVAISADRPTEWIDQDESQTIHQQGALSAVVKQTFDIDFNSECISRSKWSYVCRMVNDAMNVAKALPHGPVHINVHIDEPLGTLSEIAQNDDEFKIVENVVGGNASLTEDMSKTLADAIMSKKTMVLAGFGEPNARLDAALGEFVRRSGAVVLHEAESNMSVKPSVANIDACLSVMSDDDRKAMAPELVITVGGSTVSRMIKKYLRNVKGLDHWHISCDVEAVDSLMALSRQLRFDATSFFENINRYIQTSPSDAFADLWYKKAYEAKQKSIQYLTDVHWSDYYAIGRLLALIPRSWQLQVSNGTAIRYVQLFDYTAISRIDCNRGVSGIDGSTSTAVGASLCYDDVTLLITGDMSALYDIGALAITEITPRFKIAVLNNGGGGIFRFINSTAHLEERERCFACDVRLPLMQLAEGYGFAYFEANDKQTYDKAIIQFIKESDRPAILNIDTSSSDSAALLRRYFGL